MISMRLKYLLPLCLLGATAFAQEPAPAAATGEARLSEEGVKDFKLMASQIPLDPVGEIPIQSQGRIKSFEAYARESMLYIAGKYRPFGLKPVQAYLGIIVFDRSHSLELINIREPKLRDTLGLDRNRKMFSLAEIDGTQLEALAQPVMQKERMNSKKMTPEEKAMMEVFEQRYVLKQILTGQHLFQGLLFKPMGQSPESPSDNPQLYSAAQEFLKAIASADRQQALTNVNALIAAVKAQPGAADFAPNIAKMGSEVFYLRLQPFFWAGVLLIFAGLAFLFLKFKSFEKPMIPIAIVMVPFLLQIYGFSLRIHITGFAPVTNMYGTMLWVALGVMGFSAVLLYLYNNLKLFGFLVTGSGLLLLFTESMPLVLSPDMDPIVAVLRSNFWLSIHVLTITISYAALTIAMLLGNGALVRSLFVPLKGDEYKELGRHVYRVIQLGVFLLTAGIILGGIWADYSWGRFWGWDPKETWALIADLGFIAILHARYVGWLKDFGILAASPIGYLLVVMAWFGVNFILAAGLHSYGFSSGGTAAVIGFVSVQLALIAAALIVHKLRKQGGVAV